ncbi:hypothetical protein M6B38_268850 [Iris pallida]|uniref:Uncharacterized protein n=1 Tax=Iris pallida TaxID=29817 RepID=A0AAX6HJ96_IRIPA|nr:hypothetical protein M6B38_118565 [Iris pallida]KAJ6849920.1 hypothetical protein M6B38_268850 [Iris pallida]
MGEHKCFLLQLFSRRAHGSVTNYFKSFDFFLQIAPSSLTAYLSKSNRIILSILLQPQKFFPPKILLLSPRSTEESEELNNQGDRTRVL